MKKSLLGLMLMMIMIFAFDNAAQALLIDNFEEGNYNRWTTSSTSPNFDPKISGPFASDYDAVGNPGATKYFSLINAHNSTQATADYVSYASTTFTAQSGQLKISMDCLAAHDIYNDLFSIKIGDSTSGHYLQLLFYVGAWPRASVYDGSVTRAVYSQPDIRGGWHNLAFNYDTTTGDFSIDVDDTPMTIYSGSQTGGTMSVIDTLELRYTSRVLGSRSAYYAPASSTDNFDWQYFSINVDNIGINIPEPTTMALLVIGGLVVIQRKRR